MYMYIYKCIYTYIIDIYIYMYNTYMYIYVYTNMYICVWIKIWINTYKFMHMCKNLDTYANLYIYVFTLTCTYLHTCKHMRCICVAIPSVEVSWFSGISAEVRSPIPYLPSHIVTRWPIRGYEGTLEVGLGGAKGGDRWGGCVRSRKNRRNGADGREGQTAREQMYERDMGCGSEEGKRCESMG